MTPEVRELVEATRAFLIEFVHGPVPYKVQERVAHALYAVESAEDAATAHAAAIQHGHAWDNDEIGLR